MCYYCGVHQTCAYCWPHAHAATVPMMTVPLIVTPPAAPADLPENKPPTGPTKPALPAPFSSAPIGSPRPKPKAPKQDPAPPAQSPTVVPGVWAYSTPVYAAASLPTVVPTYQQAWVPASPGVVFMQPPSSPSK